MKDRNKSRKETKRRAGIDEGRGVTCGPHLTLRGISILVREGGRKREK